MRQKFTRWLSLVTVCFMLTVYCATAQAALLDLGPTDLPSPPGNGIPTWYRDLNRMPLDPCLSQATFAGGLAACILLPEPGFDPALPVVFPTNFPSESFYFLADASIFIPAGRIVYRAALEAAFPTGPAAGNPIVFSRIRVVADLPVAGTYKITHPYGVETVEAAAPGKRAIVFVRDIGVGPFTGALAGDLGPWLIMQGFPQTIGTETFIGNYNGASLPVTGSPFGTNFVRLEGPVGSNLDGLGNNFVQTNLFILAGKISAGTVGTPLAVDSATYTRDATTTQVNVFATTQPISNVTTGLPPNPLALANIPSALSFSDPGGTVPLMATVMLTNTAADGKFFGTASFANPATLPTTVRVTNSADIPDTTVDVSLVDEVVISEASYMPTTPNATPGTLKIVASSGDKLALPALTVSMKDGLLTVPLGSFTGSGTLLVNFPLTVGPKTYSIPPERVTVTSALLGSDTEPVTGPQNLPPVAVADAATVVPNGSVIINVAANDTDPNAGDLAVPTTVTLATPPAPTKGTLTNNGDGTITYTAGAISGIDTFGYTIKDTAGAASNVATVTVTISIAPVAAAFAATVIEDTATVIPVSSHATADIAGNPLNAIAPASLQITVAPLHGTAVLNGIGGVSYTPSLNYNGPDSFTYTVRDTIFGALSNAAVATITVTPVADRPLALNDIATTPQNTPVTINVLTNDSHPDGLPSIVVPSTLAIVTNVPLAAGTASVVAGQVVFTPAAAFTGSTSFTYTVSDNTAPTPLVSLPATVNVTVTSVNNPPVASPFNAVTNEDTPAIINVAANATDPNTALNPLNAVAPASVLVTVAPLHGIATALGDGTVRYTPSLNYNGPDLFTYTVRDTIGAVSNAAVASITVNPVADVPLSLPDLASTLQNTPLTINVLANDSHPDGLPLDPASLAIVTNAPLAAGTASVIAGQVLFTPAAAFTGTTSFTYTVKDNAAPTPSVSLPATVVVTVTPVNSLPVANNDVATTFVNTPRTINVILNDTDADGTINPASVIIGALPANATAVAGATGNVTFNATVAGTYSFTYTVKDNLGAISNPATVTVSVASVAVIADTVSVLKGQFTTATRQWGVEGTTTNVTAGTLVTIRVGSGLAGQIIGAAPVATDGRWKFSLPGNPGNVGPDATNTISVTLPSGASRLAFPIAVR